MTDPRLTEHFTKAYNGLNSGQKAAVDALEGPVVVMAGPGTGKTQILTLRIANILQKTDTPPDAILALTYTNSGVVAMRDRLRTFIGQEAYRVNIHTFHGYASSVIESHPTYFPRIIGATSADDVDLYEVARSAIENVGDDSLRPSGDPEYYVKPVLKLIASLKSDAVTAQMYAEYLTTLADNEDAYDAEGEPSTKLTRSTAFVAVFREYERLMRERRLYDYSDMLVELINAFETHDELRLECAESAQYILADEHQDANRSQNKILELLASAHPDGAESPNLFIVGDDKQAIYRFQGASLENFLYFQERFPRATVIPLTENYRSTERILQAAGKLMEGKALPGELRATKGAGTPLELITATTIDDEIAGITGRIEQLIREGVRPEDIAILLRKNKDIDAIARSLRVRNIPFLSYRDADALATADITLLIALIRASVNPENDEALAIALFLPAFQLSTGALAGLLRNRERSRLSLFEALKTHPEGARAYEFFSNIMKRAHTENALVALDDVVAGSGYMSHLMEARELSLALGAYRSVRGLIETRSARDLRYTLKDAVLLLTDLERGIATVKVEREYGTGGVSLMSLHKSKGLEFDHVFLPHAIESRFKPRADRSLFFVPPVVNQPEPEWDDERRLFYVGITRARKHVYASAHRLRTEDKEEKPLPFLSDIGEVALSQAPTAEHELPRASVMTDDELKAEYQSIINAFLESGISATALNAYLTDPWLCFMKNILRLPETKAAHQMYGTAIHAALEELYSTLRDGAPVSRESFLASFDTALLREPLSPRERSVYQKKGHEALTGYFETYQGTWDAESQTEVAFSADLTLPPGHEREKVHIRGFLDRIVVHDGIADVTDYKTGKVKSRNEILGATQSSDGGIYRQLVFYKLLLAQDGRYRMGEATIDFIEPNPRGKHKREVFSVTDEEAEALKGEIVRMVDELVTGRFMATPSTSEDAETRGLALLVAKRFGIGALGTD